MPQMLGGDCRPPRNHLDHMWHDVSSNLSDLSPLIERKQHGLDASPQTEWTWILGLVETAFRNWSGRQHAAAIDNNEMQICLEDFRNTLIKFRDSSGSSNTIAYRSAMEAIVGAALALHAALKDVRRVPFGLGVNMVAPPVPLRLHQQSGIERPVRLLLNGSSFLSSNLVSSVRRLPPKLGYTALRSCHGPRAERSCSNVTPRSSSFTWLPQLCTTY